MALVAAALATVLGGTVLGIVLTHSQPATDQKRQLKAPSNLKASLDGITVHLSWSPSAGLGNGGYYGVYRGDKWIGPVTSNSFQDTSVPLGVSQTYYVKAVLGDSSSPPSNQVSVLVAKPSLAEARLAGWYDFRWKIASQVGHWYRLSLGDRGGHWKWQFKPNCPDGACEVEVSLTEDGPDPNGPLKSMGGPGYAGTISALRSWHCTSGGPPSTAIIALQVVNAGNVHGVWTAEGLKGFISIVGSPKGPCSGNSQEETLTGRFSESNGTTASY